MSKIPGAGSRLTRRLRGFASGGSRAFLTLQRRPSLEPVLFFCKSQPRFLISFFLIWCPVLYWRRNKTERGIPIQSRHTSFWRKYDVCLNFQNAKQRYTIDFRQVTVHQHIRQQRRGGYRYTVYCHGIPIYGMKTSRFFILPWFYWTFFLSSFSW